MKSAYFKKMLMAREWYENRTVEKVFNALFSTLVLRKQRLQEHLEKRRAKVLAIAWVRVSVQFFIWLQLFSFFPISRYPPLTPSCVESEMLHIFINVE